MPVEVTLIHPFERDSYLLVEADVVAGIFAYRQTRVCDPEAGGILLGMRRGEHIHVTAFTGPGPQDHRVRTGFHRSRRYHQAQALRYWASSAGKVDYLGEWHTHPESRPSPSGIDEREWRVLMRRYEAPLVFAIAGTGTAMWFGVGHKQKLAAALPTLKETFHG